MLSVIEQAERRMFISPSSGKPLLISDSGLRTEDQLESFRIVDGRALFLEPRGLEGLQAEKMSESYTAFDGPGERVRRLLRATLFASIRSRAAVAAFKEFADRTVGAFVLGVGGGPVRDFSAVNLNIQPWPNVEVVADAHSLPYAAGSVDHISCLAVLEHLARPGAAISEMIRVLRPGGFILIETPGLQPYHGYPNHFQNFTLTGHDLLLSSPKIKKIRSGAGIGPTSALVSLASEFLRQYFPGGKLVAPMFKGSLGFILIQLDRSLSNHQNAFMLSGSSFFLGQKIS